MYSPSIKIWMFGTLHGLGQPQYKLLETNRLISEKNHPSLIFPSVVSISHWQFANARDQIANICWIIEKAKEFQKNIYFCFIDYVKAFVWSQQMWKILQEMGIPEHLTFPLRNLYASQEAIVRTGHGTTDWFQIGKGVGQGCIWSPCLFNLYADEKCWADN